MEHEERQRREDIHRSLINMGMCQELSDEAALKIGVGSINIGVEFCLDADTRERVRNEAQKVPQKTGLRSQGSTSLRGLSAPPPANLLGNAAMGPSSSMALVVASIDAEPDDDATEETAQLRACVVTSSSRRPLRACVGASKQRRWPAQAVPTVGKRGVEEGEERRLDGAPTMRVYAHTLHTPCTCHTHNLHTPRTRQAHATPCTHTHHAHAPRTRTTHTHHAHTHTTGGELYTYAEFVEEYRDEAGAVWARAGRDVESAHSTPKKPKAGARDADGDAPCDGGGGGGGGLQKVEGKLMDHLSRLRHYLSKLEGLDAPRAQDCLQPPIHTAAASTAYYTQV